MSKFSAFMKQNKQAKGNEKFAPTTSLIGSDGTPKITDDITSTQ